ncbi:YdcF family protein [Pseudanabaena biceps]|nr:YdcF family protein [Pseudanabaena biceps]
MFDLLTNILIWIIAIPVLIILFKAIPKDWFRLFGLVIFTALIAIIFANFRFVEDPIPKIVVDFLAFPFTLTGILLLLMFFNYTFRLKDLKIKSGEKVDNKGDSDRIATVTKELLIVLLLFAIATNNATSELFTCYLEQQGVNAVEQSYRRPVLNLTDQELAEFKRGVYDLIVVLAENPPYEPRLQAAVQLWNAADMQQKPYIILSGGRRTSYPPTKGYPCLTPPEAPPSRTKEDVRNAIASRAGTPNTGLQYDPRLETYFTNRDSTSDGLGQVDLTEADQMCASLLSLANIEQIRPFIIIEPAGRSIRTSGDEIDRLIKSMEKNKLLREDPRNSRRLLVITSPIEATRTFLSFRNQDLNASLTTATYPSDSHKNLVEECPWPIGKRFNLKPRYFLFNAESFVRSERVWTEVKELIFYTLRFWLRPPLTDERPYYPKAVPTTTTEKR